MRSQEARLRRASRPTLAATRGCRTPTESLCGPETRPRGSSVIPGSVLAKNAKPVVNNRPAWITRWNDSDLSAGLNGTRHENHCESLQRGRGKLAGAHVARAGVLYPRRAWRTREQRPRARGGGVRGDWKARVDQTPPALAGAGTREQGHGAPRENDGSGTGLAAELL